MAINPNTSVSKRERADFAVRLAQLGDLEGARAAFVEAIAFDRRNPDLHYNLAVVVEQLGDIDRAAQSLTAALHLRPDFRSAASRLSRLLARFEIEDVALLIPSGLGATLNTTGLAHQPVVDATVKWLIEFDPDLTEGIGQICRAEISERDLGRSLVAAQTADTLRAGLLQKCLRAGVIKHPGLERVLSGVRAALLLDCAPARFEDRSLTDLALALICQGWNNDHAWAETPEETAALANLATDRDALLAGDRPSVVSFIRTALYRPLAVLVDPPLSATEAHRLKPRSLRETIEPHIRELERQRVAAAAVPALRPLADATSLKVAGQYEAAPYPRWTSLHVSSAGALKRSLGEYFTPDRLAFMDAAFDVLIAGCGTGQQALQAASAYGPGARLLAMDLSRASLGYAADMAAKLDIKNVSFLQGDILDSPLLDRTFDIIECVGVLHHMADWRAGWRALLGQLKPKGLMYIGLYSAVSRQTLRGLRSEPDYPGPGCSDDEARAYRRSLLVRDGAAHGGDLKISRDFYALNAFRDLTLHESEAHVTLEEIDAFITANGLAFHGFTLDEQVIADLRARLPHTATPGGAAEWAAFERDHPRTFDGMYRFWVERGN
jgi:SAM-dependent methyltransferase/tetratricopeptide (TPR) repeat protein